MESRDKASSNVGVASAVMDQPLGPVMAARLRATWPEIQEHCESSFCSL